MFKSIGIILVADQRRRAVLILFAMAIAAALEMVGIGAIPAFVGLLTQPEQLGSVLPERLDRILQRDLGEVTVVAAAILAVMFLLKNIFVALLVHSENRLLRDVAVRTASRLFGGYMRSPYTFHLQRNPATLMNNIGNEVTGAVDVMRGAATVIREGLVLVIVLLLLMLLDPLVSVTVFLLLGTVAAAFYMTVRTRLGTMGELMQQRRGRRLQAVNQGLSAIKDAIVLGREAFLIRAFEVENVELQDHDVYRRTLGALPRLFLEVLAILAIVLVAATFVLLDRPSATMLPLLALLAVGVVRLVPAINAITTALTFVRGDRPSLELVARELEMLEQHQAAEVSRTPGLPIEGSISLHNVSYRYPEAGTDALTDISLDIRVGAAVAFVGPSGSGKTTLVDVILGLLRSSEGTVLVDDRDVNESVAAWQRQIGYIPQDIYLMDASIRRNIAFGLPDEEIDASAIAAAVRAAQLEPFIAMLPNGIETVVGNRGVRLSGGQRQRIGIARALYNNPRVLVMDEATSALDNEMEREVMDAIAGLHVGRTLVMIAHRLTTVKSCDCLFLLEHGRLVDQGTYGELASRQPRFDMRVTERAAQFR